MPTPEELDQQRKLMAETLGFDTETQERYTPEKQKSPETEDPIKTLSDARRYLWPLLEDYEEHARSLPGQLDFSRLISRGANLEARRITESYRAASYLEIQDSHEFTPHTKTALVGAAQLDPDDKFGYRVELGKLLYSAGIPPARLLKMANFMYGIERMYPPDRYNKMLGDQGAYRLLADTLNIKVRVSFSGYGQLDILTYQPRPR